jgi:hypothetical protein
MRRDVMKIHKLILLVVAATLAATEASAQAQDLNIPIPTDSLEYLLTTAPFEMGELRGTRGQGDRTSRADLTFDSLTSFMVKLAPAPRGGEEFNNVPRYEVAAYELQKLFLDEPEVVVPTTVMRAFPLDWYRERDSGVDATMRRTRSVVVVIQAFLQFVGTDDVWDEDRFQADTTYARYWGNLNILTYLIRHNDSNIGNLMISTLGPPRVFSVDNGVAFNSIDSDRGTRWRNLLVDRFPAATVARLRTITEEQLHQRLGVLAQWRIEDEQLVPMEPTENINPRDGVRERNGIVQFGLTQDEIDDVWYRLETFLGAVASGRYQTF